MSSITRTPAARITVAAIATAGLVSMSPATAGSSSSDRDGDDDDGGEDDDDSEVGSDDRSGHRAA